MSLAGFGARYERVPASEFRAGRVVQQLEDSSRVDEFRHRAALLEGHAERLDALAFDTAAPDSGASALAARADLYRKRAGELETRAAAREATLARRHGKRMLWVYSICVDLLVASLATLLPLAASFRALRQRKVPRLTAAAVVAGVFLLAIPGTVAFARMWSGYGTPPWHLVEATVGPSVLGVTRLSAALHVLAASLFVWPGVFTAPRLPRRAAGAGSTRAEASDPEMERAARELAQTIRLMRYFLYVAAAMLVVSVVTSSTLFQWALSFVDPAQATLFAGVQELTRHAVTAHSLVSSGLLLAGFGTSALQLRLMSGTLAERALPVGSATERQEWMKEHEVAAPGVPQQLKALATILAPVATSVLAPILQSLA
ncbi:MAG: hypothetical protein ACJ8GN_26890 [Longimicrobiaceae bacterium]